MDPFEEYSHIDLEITDFRMFGEAFYERADRLIRFTGMCRYAIQQMRGLPRLVQVMAKVEAHKSRNETGKEDHSDRSRTEHAEELASIAVKEIESDFEILHGMTVVLLWGALESVMRDFLVSWLVRYPEARRADAIAKLRVRIGEYDGLSEDDRMRYIIGLLEREHGSHLGPGISRFTRLLHFFDIVPEIDAGLKDHLLEMSTVRNVLVHRGGVADERFVELCPNARWKLGDVIQISSEELGDYLQSTYLFMFSVAGAAMSLEYFRPDPDTDGS